MHRIRVPGPRRTHRMSDEPTAETTRREVLKTIFVAPAILTLPAIPSFASAGSGTHDFEDPHKDRKEKKDKKNAKYGNFGD